MNFEEMNLALEGTIAGDRIRSGSKVLCSTRSKTAGKIALAFHQPVQTCDSRVCTVASSWSSGAVYGIRVRTPYTKHLPGCWRSVVMTIEESCNIDVSEISSLQ